MKLNRRNLILGGILGLFGFKPCLPRRELQPGQIWEDRDKAWSCDSCEFSYLLLSCDRDYNNPEDLNRYWKVAVFQHPGSRKGHIEGYFGAFMRYFTDEEVEKMYYKGMMV